MKFAMVVRCRCGYCSISSDLVKGWRLVEIVMSVEPEKDPISNWVQIKEEEKGALLLFTFLLLHCMYASLHTSSALLIIRNPLLV